MSDKENPSDNASYTKGWGPQPNPGSTEAFDLGCRCPRMDNGHGKGYHHYPGKPVGKRVWVTVDCTLHNG